MPMTTWKSRALAGGTVLGATLAVVGLVAYLNQDWLIDHAIRQRLSDAESHSIVNDPEQFDVVLCGTGSPEPSAARAQACTLVSVGGKMFVFDAGEGASKSLAASGVALADIERVFLTHLHSDHFNGLGALINQSWIWGRSQPLDVAGPTGTAEVVGALNDAYRIDNGFRTANMPDLDSKRAAARANPMDIVIPSQAHSVRVYDDDGVTVDAYRVVHDPVEPAFGYIIRSQGKKVFISGDTRLSPSNLPAMQDADLVVHEAYASHLVRRAIPIMREMGMQHDAEVAQRTIAYHADTIELAKQAAEAGVKHLALTHLTPYPDTAIKRHMFTAGMREYYGGTLTVGTDGLVIVV
ncbi:MBL fold metallo-hydrolase [Mycolicibacterium sp. 018/SC-01/001]|uniref:MBL fold metallo-hydrolase n=1 Tax=Mycolicibacterium sp. 018/SC-01/001 TaxID=2592069 RepID=UPI00163DA69D|nr:MBL fold metallo-hydrolase [Mycolicibacterium sp. 018/SC-01/001]